MAKVIGICIAAEKKGEMHIMEEVEAIAHQGLEGDRFFRENGNVEEPYFRALTLIQSEALEALEKEKGIQLEHWESRRNLLTRGVNLNELVDREFFVGEVLLKGFEWCEPCAYLEKRTRPGVLGGLAQRGGLRAQILQGGTIRKGDLIRVD